MTDFDNPAKRLLDLLSQARSIKKDMPCRQAWHQLLETQQDEALLMSRLGKVMALPIEIVEAMKRHYPTRANTWQHWFSKVNSAFITQSLGAQFETFSNNIDDHTIAYLGMTAELLGNREHVATIPTDDAKRLRDEMAELLAEVLMSDLDPHAKDTIARQLQRLIVAIDEYKLTGAMPILDAVDASIGHIAYDVKYREALDNTSIGKRFTELLGAAANVVTVVVGIPQLPAGIAAAKQLLGWN